MDGTLAVLFLVAGLTDMGFNYCPNEGCFAENPTDGRLGLSYGNVMFQEENISEEVFLRYDVPVTYGPFQPTMGLSGTMDGDLWAGAGAAWTAHLNQAYLQLYLMPGLWAQGNGPDLGSVVEFRSGVEVGWEARNGIRYGLTYDHRSNADLSSTNPGMETFQFKISFPIQ